MILGYFEPGPLLVVVIAAAVGILAVRTLVGINRGGEERKLLIHRAAIGGIIATSVAMIAGSIVSWCFMPDRSHDGFGRTLTQFPLLPEDRQWVGIEWATFDTAVYCAGIYLIYRLWLAQRDNK